MDGKYRAYPEYKDSGVEWLGKLPTHWLLPSLKMVIDVRDGTHETPQYVEKSGDSFPLVTSKDVTSGVLQLEQCKYISSTDYESIIQRSKVDLGDILMPMIGTVGSPIIVSSISDFAIKNLALFKTSNNKKINGSFLNYFLQSSECNYQFILDARGGVQNFVSLGTLRDLGFPFPPKNEQQQIAKFLDHETAKIDTLIEKQQQLITLLKEKRQAVISHAVTKGLNPDAPMRDSGVEWLGQVPAHWEVCKLKHIISSLESGVSVNAADAAAQNDELGVLKTSCVYTREFRVEENKTVVKEEYARVKCPIKKGAIIISRMNTPDLVGASALVEVEASNIFLPDRLWQTVFEDEDKQNPKFIAYFMRIKGFRNQISLAAEGASSSMQNIAKDDYLSINIAFPKVREQDEIVHFLEKQISDLNKLETSANDAIELMQERRTALISAAVTGKIDVRHPV